MSREQAPIEAIVAYHQATKHRFERYANGPGRLDWATQPAPFRRYRGAALIRLDHVAPHEGPLYQTALLGAVPPQPLSRRTLSQLLYDSLALSAWKRAGQATWSLRVNPSSGNLHPTEGYVLSGPVTGLWERPVVAHYAPREHALEIRAELDAPLWEALWGGRPGAGVMIGLTSIHWREAWKYGERALRYCHHDVGHALGAIAVAAAGLGWQARLVDTWATHQLAALLGVSDAQGAEPELPDCLVAVHARGVAPPRLPPERAVLERLANLKWHGQANRLSPRHVSWQAIDAATAAMEKPVTSEIGEPTREDAAQPMAAQSGPLLRGIIHRRRSAVDMDGRSGIDRETFYAILGRTLPGNPRIPFNTLPWPPQVHLALFVHRVTGLAPGLYFLVRDGVQGAALRAALGGDFAWARPAGCPAELALYELARGDARELAKHLSCHQDIAADGCFSLAMVARFEPALREHGAWLYGRLYWECGMVGQVLYLEAHAHDIAATGIGCFFDDPVHDLLGIKGLAYQSLYHFTLGVAVEDPRLLTLPPYPGPAGGPRG